MPVSQTFTVLTTYERILSLNNYTRHASFEATGITFRKLCSHIDYNFNLIQHTLLLDCNWEVVQIYYYMKMVVVASLVVVQDLMVY